MAFVGVSAALLASSWHGVPAPPGRLSFRMVAMRDDAILAAPPPSLPNLAPEWHELREKLLATPTGGRLSAERDLQAQGRGPPHTDALLRLFDAKDESEVRVTLYRDSAAWCPYCQKVWLMLEEKR